MKISSLSKVVLFIGLSAVPLISFAQSGTQVTAGMGTLNNLIQTITSTVAASIATLLFSAALIAFFVGVVQYIWGAREGDQTAITKGNLFMKWSLVALFCMFSVYGIIRFGQNFLCNGPCSNEITIPNIKFTPGGSNAANNSDPYSPGRANNGDVGTAGRANSGTETYNDSRFNNAGGNVGTDAAQTGTYNDARFNNNGGNVGSGSSQGDVDPETVNGFQ